MEDEYTTTESSLVDFVYTTHETIINPEQAAPSKPEIKLFLLNLKSITTTNTWVTDPQDNIISDRHIYGTDSQPRVEYKTICLDRKQITNPGMMQETISSVLSRWSPIPEHERQYVIDMIVLRTLEMLESISPKHDLILDVNCEIKLKLDHLIHVSDVMDWMMQRAYEESVQDMVPGIESLIMQRSFEESSHNMIPASDSSIKALQRTVVVDGSCESYSVCLEDFPTGCEVLCLPCWHPFHPDCIQKWLSSSHYCPNCRYEMPTTNEQDSRKVM